MTFVRAPAPLTVMSDWITRSLPMVIVPAGTSITSATSLVASEAASAARRLTHVCAVALQAGVEASLDPSVTVHVSARAGPAASRMASTARGTANRRRIRTGPTITVVGRFLQPSEVWVTGAVGPCRTCPCGRMIVFLRTSSRTLTLPTATVVRV